MTQQLSVLEQIDAWIARGWLSQLNRAFVRFLQDQDKDKEAMDTVLWAGALVSHQLDRGEVYLDLKKLCTHPGLTLAIPSDDAWSAEHDIAHAELSTLNNSLADWQSALKQSKLVNSGEGNTPLVLEGNRLYLRRYWQYQQILNSCIKQRLQPIRDNLPEALLDQLDCLFANPIETPDWQKIACVLALRTRFSIITGGPGTGKTTTLTKLLALLIHLNEHENKHSKHLTILLAAPTGKAAARVSESIGKAVNTLAIDEHIKQAIPKKAATLHRLLGSRHGSRSFIHNHHNPLVADIVIVDEASMIDLEMMASLLDALSNHTQLILLGDKDQLASVEAGSVMGDLCEGADKAAYDDDTRAWIGRYASQAIQAPESAGSDINQQTVMLRYSHRFNEQSGIGQLAKAVNLGDAMLAQSILADTDRYTDLVPEQRSAYLKFREQPNTEAANDLLHKLMIFNNGENNGKPKPRQGYGYYLNIIESHRPSTSEDYDNWAKQVLAAFDSFQVLCALRRGFWGIEGLNQRIETWLFPKQKPSLWYEGRPVMITRNDYNLGLMNGDIGIALKDHTGKLRIAFPSDDPLSEVQIRWISPMRLPDVETAFAITVHKSQGSEFNHVALVLPEHPSPVITRELIYTGITRAKENFTLLESSADGFKLGILASCK